MPGPGADTTPGPARRDFQTTRSQRRGTHIAGTEGLSEPGGEHKRLRLMAGKVVPGTRYRILRWLGEGGMGVVYEAEHIDIERRVALKILRFDLSQQERMVQVFRDEARAASRIGSTNIVEIFDFGELSDGRLFFCMELLEGHDLVPATEDEWTEPGRLIGILRQCAKGLYAAHRAGIVHRDIKPENVILHRSREGRELVKIVDFGISSMLAANDEDGGTIAGTPHYMAPEQIRGQAFDGRLDMYALGCMAYEMLAGHPPFFAEDLEELLRQHLAERPPSIRELKPDREVPPELEAVIMRCLAKKPESRFKDMADLEASLCEAQIAGKLHTPWDDLPLPEVEDDRRQKLLRNMPSPDAATRKRRWLWPLVAGLSVLVAGGAVAFALSGPGALQEQERDFIEELTIAARNAAALTHFVYPPIEDPKATTAYQKVLELEDLEGNARDHGVERGGELRSQFATTLTTLGDKYWEVPGARGFARDYYMQSLLFEDNDRARERSNVTPGWFAEFAEKARDGSFTGEELAAAQFLSAFAEEDEAKKQEKLDQALAMSDESLTGVAATAAETVARSSGLNLRGSKRRPATAPVPAPAETDPAEAPPDPAATTGEGGEGELALEEDDPRGKKGKKGVHFGDAKSDPKKAAQLAEDGKAALASGRRAEAESLFHQAVGYDRRNAAALSGLSDVYFDTGSNQKAVLYAERAVQAASKNSTYRLKLGDAYFKVLRYRDALDQYEEAKKLGSSRADERISKVKAKIGG
jgi:serine/threonine protein kinase/tetratricopeptide (TPR) repeat protein